MTKRWHILQAGGTWTLARHLPARMDLCVAGRMPLCHPVRLMHQIRQDLWRALQRVRGFSPVIVLEPDHSGWCVRAGGRVTGRTAQIWSDRVHDVLTRDENRIRWARHAGPWEVQE